MNFRTKVSNNSHAQSLKTLDPNFKGTVFVYLGEALLWNKLSAKNHSLLVCKERLLLNQRVFYFPKDFYLVEEVNQQLSMIAANGILEHLLSIYIDYGFLNVKSVDHGPLPLDVESISGIFYVAGVLYLISLITFVAEILYFYCKTKLRAVDERPSFRAFEH